MPDTDTQPRSLAAIARDIERNWPEPYFGAVPYIRAMRVMTTMRSTYGQDTADDVVIRFLTNARTFRGGEARRIKAELKALLKSDH